MEKSGEISLLYCGSRIPEFLLGAFYRVFDLRGMRNFVWTMLMTYLQK